MKNEETLIKQLLGFMNDGKYGQALQVLLTNPSDTYPEEASPLLGALIHYFDATAFRTRGEAYLATKSLIAELEREVLLSLDYDQIDANLEYQERLLYYSILEILPTQVETLHPEVPTLNMLFRNKKSIPPEEIAPLLAYSPEAERNVLRERIEMMNRNLETMGNVGSSTDLFQQTDPWLPFSYDTEIPFNLEKKTHLPCLLMEPYKGDWESFFETLGSQHAIFVFENETIFKQMFQFPLFTEAMKKDDHIIYILDRFPEGWKGEKELVPYCRASAKEPFFRFVQHLEKGNDLQKLYHTAQQLRFSLEKGRLGESRLLPLLQREGCRTWNDQHKVFAYDEADVKHSIDKACEGKILERRKKRSGKKKLAHIVPQVVDGGHAPSRLLHTIFNHHNQEQFELYLFSTEALLFRQKEYPYNVVASDSSLGRAEKRLHHFAELGVHVDIDDGTKSLAETAFHLRDILAQHEIDIAIFHGPDLINTICSQCCDVPLRLLFEHGTPPTYPTFDWVLFSDEIFEKKYMNEYAKLGIQHAVLPFTVDCRMGWVDAPYLRHELGLPEDGFLMTTITNHLDSRLTEKMCQAIAEILLRCPLAYYVPMGPVEDKTRLLRQFFEYGVDDKVYFIGSRAEPSQYARSMQLYLNEFPFGSGLGILDAMAAGCPVVTMQDPKGPPQANYGAIYFGHDKAVKKDDLQGYVDLACQLYENKELYGEWSEYALKRYDQRIDIQEYMTNFEKVLMS